MRRMNIIWGILLIGIGVITLLQTLGIIVGGLGFVWAIVFGVIGATFVWTFITDRSRWWALIPACVLLSLAVLAFLQSAMPSLSERWSGALFMGGLSLAFWAVYIVRREFWWALIPAGVLLTLAVVAGMEDRGVDTAAIFFVGLGLTFAILTLLTRMKWPLIPATVLVVLGGIIWVGQTALLVYLNTLWPVLLILGGVYLIFRVARR